MIHSESNCFFQTPDGVNSQSLVPDEVTHENESEVRLG
jgi:hypothetical protein